MAYDKEMTGTLWYNLYRKSDNQPIVTGKIQVKGVEYRVAGWAKTLDSGRIKLLNLKIQDPDEYNQNNNDDPALSDDACPF
jgi:hypothetical protein